MKSNRIKNKCNHYSEVDDGFYCWKCLQRKEKEIEDYYKKELFNLRSIATSQSSYIQRLKNKYILLKKINYFLMILPLVVFLFFIIRGF